MLSLAIRDRLVLVAERLDGQHRAERLVLDHRHRAVAAVEHGGQVVEAVGQRRVVGPGPAAAGAWRPRRARAATYASTFSRCAAEISGPVSAFVVERPAEPDLLGAARPARRRTRRGSTPRRPAGRRPSRPGRSAGTPRSARSRARPRGRRRRTRCWGSCRRARGRPSSPCRAADGHDPLAGRQAAGERDQVDAGVLAERGAGAAARRRAPGWPTPAGTPASSSRPHQQDRGVRGQLAGLEHEGVAGGQAGRDLPGGLQQRVVPRRDQRRRRRPARARCG